MNEKSFYPEPTRESLRVTGIAVDHAVKAGKPLDEVLAEGQAQGGSGHFYYDPAHLRHFSLAVASCYNG